MSSLFPSKITRYHPGVFVYLFTWLYLFILLHDLRLSGRALDSSSECSINVQKTCKMNGFYLFSKLFNWCQQQVDVGLTCGLCYMASNWPSSPTLVDIMYWLNCLSNFCSLTIWPAWPTDSLSLWAVRLILPQLEVQSGLSLAHEASQHESALQLVLSLSLCSIADHWALILIFFLIISQNRVRRPSFWLLHLLAAAQRPLPICHNLTSWRHSLYFIQSLPKLSLSPEPLENLLCLLIPIYSPYLFSSCSLGTVLKLQPLPDGRDKVPGLIFRWSGSSAPEWSLRHIKKGKRKKKPLQSRAHGSRVGCQ